MSVSRAIGRSIGKEIEGLLGKRAGRVAQATGKGATLAAEGWADRVAKRVLGRDAAKISGQAGHLSRLRVPTNAVAEKTISKRAAKKSGSILENQVVGRQREGVVRRLLRALFPASEKYTVHGEQYLRTKNGAIAKDAVTGESRRIDFVVFRDKEIVRSIEVTSEKVSKAAQIAKETRMRGEGAKWLLHPELKRLVRLPASIKTKVIRLP